MKYRLNIEEYREKEIIVEADSSRQAWEKVKNAWNNRKIEFTDNEENIRCLDLSKEP